MRSDPYNTECELTDGSIVVLCDDCFYERALMDEIVEIIGDSLEYCDGCYDFETCTPDAEVEV